MTYVLVPQATGTPTYMYKRAEEEKKEEDDDDDEEI